MKAIVIREFGPPEVLRYEDVPDPTPAPGEVLIAVHATTINRVLDCGVRAGTQHHRGIVLPLIPGVDATGTVRALGPGVAGFRIGEHVATAGTMPLNTCADCPGRAGKDCGEMGMMGVRRPGGDADLVAVPACWVSRIPDGVSFADAAVAMRHVPTAWNLLINLGKAKASDWVLIMGAAGNLGSIGIQIAKNIVGAKVICAAGSDDRVAVGRSLGADHGINYNTHDLETEVRRLTGGRGVDLLYDNIANPATLSKAIDSVAREGRVVTAGAHGGPVVPVNFFHVYDRRLTIMGQPGARREDIPACFAAVAKGQIKVRYERILPLSQAAEAHRMTETNPGSGKIILDPTLG